MSRTSGGRSAPVVAGVAREQTGAALILVLLIIVVLTAVGGFMIIGVNRNTELGSGFQKNVAGLHAAEAGLNMGAAQVQTAMQNYGLPTNCNAQTLAMSGRTVTYTLSVPGGTAGSCTETPSTLVLPAGDPFEGLQANVYTYNLASQVVNSQGYTEANASMQFQARSIPMFQFLAFYVNDLEIAPIPPSVLNGRIHTNGDLYLNSQDCATGLHILGQITLVGSGNAGTAPLNRGRKDQNSAYDQVWISLDGSNTNVQILGLTGPGDTSCATVTTRQVPQSEITTFNGRIHTGLKTINRPGESDLLCPSWGTCPGGVTGTYWQRADLRIVLDANPVDVKQLQAGPIGPALFPVQVLRADGTLDTIKTNALTQLMLQRPGVITYSDLPSGKWDCVSNSNCESKAYSVSGSYSPVFPTSPVNGCTLSRGPRAIITAGNYCYDYRYGGYFDWREMKPMLMLNIDWMELDEWNRNNGTPNVLFDPAGTANGGLVIFLSVHGANSSGANNYGVRLYDTGRIMRNAADPGVAFASDLPFYVAGTFNCPNPNVSGGTSVPPTCGASGAQKPASIVADTINVFSCGYLQGMASDCKTVNMDLDQWAGVGVLRPQDEGSTSKGFGFGPTASGPSGYADIINAAFLAGTDRTWCPTIHSGLFCDGSGSQPWYGGGLENYIRFHESWVGLQLYYQGSFVAVGTPQHTCWAFQTQWTAVVDDPTYTCTAHPGTPPQGFHQNNVYSAPNRNFFYDVSFNNVNSLPPLTPRSISLKEVYFTELFQ